MYPVRLVCEDCKQEFEYLFTYDAYAQCPHCGAEWLLDWKVKWAPPHEPWIVGPWRGEK